MSTHKFSKQPLYLQVRDLLVERISGGQWRPGTLLPSEDELARELGTSMGTVRKALDDMEASRLVVRRQGGGTIVLDQSSDEALSRFNTICDENGQPLDDEPELLRQTRGAVTAMERTRLQLDAGDVVLRTVLLRRNQGRPYMYEEASLALSRFPDLDAGDVGKYRLPALAQRCGFHLVGARERVTLTNATSEVARHLGVESRWPLLKLDRVVTASSGRPVEWRLGLCCLPDSAAYAVRIQ